MSNVTSGCVICIQDIKLYHDTAGEDTQVGKLSEQCHDQLAEL